MTFSFFLKEFTFEVFNAFYLGLLKTYFQQVLKGANLVIDKILSPQI